MLNSDIVIPQNSCLIRDHVNIQTAVPVQKSPIHFFTSGGIFVGTVLQGITVIKLLLWAFKSLLQYHNTLLQDRDRVFLYFGVWWIVYAWSCFRMCYTWFLHLLAAVVKRNTINSSPLLLAQPIFIPLSVDLMWRCLHLFLLISFSLSFSCCVFLYPFPSLPLFLPLQSKNKLISIQMECGPAARGIRYFISSLESLLLSLRQHFSSLSPSLSCIPDCTGSCGGRNSSLAKFGQQTQAASLS